MGRRTIALLAGLLDVFCTMMVIGALGGLAYIVITETDGPQPPPNSTSQGSAYMLSIGLIAGCSVFWLLFRWSYWTSRKGFDEEKYRKLRRITAIGWLVIAAIRAIDLVTHMLFHK